MNHDTSMKRTTTPRPMMRLHLDQHKEMLAYILALLWFTCLSVAHGWRIPGLEGEEVLESQSAWTACAERCKKGGVPVGHCCDCLRCARRMRWTGTGMGSRRDELGRANRVAEASNVGLNGSKFVKHSDS